MAVLIDYELTQVERELIGEGMSIEEILRTRKAIRVLEGESDWYNDFWNGIVIEREKRILKIERT